MRYITIAIVIAIAASALGCDDPFPTETVVTDFQILGMRAEPPYISQEEETQMEALWVKPERTDGTYRVAWFFCADYLYMEDTQSSTCRQVTEPMVREITQDVAEHTIQDNALLTPQETGAYNITAVVMFCDGSVATQIPKQFDVRHLNQYCNGDTSSLAYYPLAYQMIYEQSPPEEIPKNPVFDELLLNGEAVEDNAVIERDSNEGACGFEANLEVGMTPDAYEQLSSTLEGLPPIEVNWYATGGELDEISTVSFEPEEQMQALWRINTPGVYQLYVVARRFPRGVTYRKFRLELK